MKIRKNTKEHSAIFEVLKRHETDKDRNQLIKLFTLKAGELLEERKPVEEAKNFADLYYSLNYTSILNNLLDKDHLLNKSEDDEGLYYFESSYAAFETPFQITAIVEKEIEGLLKDKKFKARAPKSLEEETESEEEGKVRKLVPDHVANPEKVEEEAEMEAMPELVSLPQEETKPKETLAEPETPEPLIDEVLGEVKEDKVLSYYQNVQELILPFLKDRPLFEMDLVENGFDTEKLPDWLKTINIYLGEINGEYVICQNFDHLKWLVENGLYELKGWTSRNKNLKLPDVVMIKLVFQTDNASEIRNVMQACLDILEICELTGFLIKANDAEFNLHVPLDGKSNLETVQDLADVLGKLMIKKVGKALDVKKSVKIESFDHSIGKTFLIPFSVKTDLSIALPIRKDDLEDELNYSFPNVIEKIKNDTSYHSNLLNLKYNADAELQKLTKRYGFLLD